MNTETTLLRQVHPSFVQQGQASSQAFHPTLKDQKRLSVYDGDQISPDDAYEHYTTTLSLASVGVMGVSVAECRQCELTVRPDPEEFPEHVLVDFSGYSENEIKKKAKQLKAFANHRGWLYRFNGGP